MTVVRENALPDSDWQAERVTDRRIGSNSQYFKSFRYFGMVVRRKDILSALFVTNLFDRIFPQFLSPVRSQRVCSFLSQLPQKFKNRPQLTLNDDQ